MRSGHRTSPRNTHIIGINSSRAFCEFFWKSTAEKDLPNAANSVGLIAPEYQLNIPPRYRWKKFRRAPGFWRPTAFIKDDRQPNEKPLGSFNRDSSVARAGAR